MIAADLAEMRGDFATRDDREPVPTPQPYIAGQAGLSSESGCWSSKGSVGTAGDARVVPEVAPDPHSFVNDPALSLSLSIAMDHGGMDHGGHAGHGGGSGGGMDPMACKVSLPPRLAAPLPIVR